jgi:hypothetical protein
VIKVERTGEGDPLEFDVIVRVGRGETRHHVTMAGDTCERLTMGTHTPERCIEAAFQFLLDREPKESILRRFEVTVISCYFPEFERELPRYLSQSWSLVTVSALVATGQIAQITYLNRAMDNGLTQEQAGEVVTHLAFYAGWPNAFSALPVVKEVLEKRPR